MASVTLKSGRRSPLERRHPWVFSNAIAKVEGQPQRGQTVSIRAADGTPLGQGAYSPQSQIAVRVWTFDPDTEVNPAFFRNRLERAFAARRELQGRPDLNAYRLVNAESDGLPGLIVDRYADYLVCQFLSAGVERWKRELVEIFAALRPGFPIYERSDVDVRQKEGLEPQAGVLAGEAPPELVEIQEGPCRFLVDLQQGHKTGFYLDQRDNRARIAAYADGADVLNCFAYTGGFGIAALQASATRVTNIESSAAVLGLLQRNVTLNGLNGQRVENVEGNVFGVLRQYRNDDRTFDLIVLDPPKFAESRSQVPRASRGYKDINWLAFRLLRPGGILFTFSCSGHMKEDLFQKIVADAALDAERDARIIRRLSQGPDHPTALNFPEGTYLKGFICQAW